MAHLRDLLDEKERLRELDGWQVRKSLYGLRRSLGVFEGNSRELQGFLGHHGDAKKTREALDVLEFTDPPGFQKYLDEVDRLLHNFLASAESLRKHVVEIQIIHLEDVPDDPDTSGYRERGRAVFESRLGCFVRELRHHVLKARIPETGGFAIWSPDPAEVVSGVALNRTELRSERGWGKKAHRYMEDAGDDILIHQFVAEHRDLAVDLCTWFDGAIQRRNRRALVELSSRETEIAAAWGPAISD